MMRINERTSLLQQALAVAGVCLASLVVTGCDQLGIDLGGDVSADKGSKAEGPSARDAPLKRAGDKTADSHAAELAVAKAELAAAKAELASAQAAGARTAPVNLADIDPNYPSDAEWDALKTEVTIKGSSARNCETKVLRGYLRAKCGANGSGAPKAVKFASQEPKNSLARLSDGKLELAHPYVAGTTFDADFSWEGASHRLHVEWPAGALQPELVGEFGGAASVLDTASTDPNVHIYTARIGAADHKNSQGVPLARAVDMLRQDRANFHKFGKRDTGDSSDPLFTTKEARASLPTYLEKLPDQVSRAIEQRMPLVRVEIDERGGSPVVRVSILDQGALL